MRFRFKPKRAALPVEPTLAVEGTGPHVIYSDDTPIWFHPGEVAWLRFGDKTDCPLPVVIKDPFGHQWTEVEPDMWQTQIYHKLDPRDIQVLWDTEECEIPL